MGTLEFVPFAFCGNCLHAFFWAGTSRGKFVRKNIVWHPFVFRMYRSRDIVWYFENLLGFSNDTYTRAPASANFTQGLKYGIVGGGVLIFLIGLLHFDNFLGVFQPVAHGLAAKLTGIFS